MYTSDIHTHLGISMYDTTPHLSNPPLIMALAKVEFAKLPLAKLESSIEDIHDMLREHYPDLQNGIANNLNLNLTNKDNGEFASNVKAEKSPFWLFRSADYDWAIQIDTNGILVSTRAYVSSEDLCHRIRTILDALDTAVKITHTRYVGVRFVNKIKYDADGEFGALRPGYIQKRLSFTDGMGGSSYNARYRIGDGWLDIRSILVVGGHEVTDDLLEVAASLNLAKEPLSEVFVILDFDCKHVTESFEKYNLEALDTKIMSLTESGKRALANVLTEKEIERRI